MENSPFISVVTPCLNMEKSIARTLRAFEMQRASFEHLVWDGGSTDKTHEIVRGFEGKYPLRLVVGENTGVYGNVVAGHRQTTGEVMGWIAGDDFYLPWALRVVEHIFKKYPEVQWLYGIPSVYYEASGLCATGRMAKYYVQSFIRRGWYRGGRFGFLQQESMFWRRSLWNQSNAEEVMLKYRYAGDFQLWRAFAEHAKLHTVASALACFTVREGQFSGAKEAEYFKECGASVVSYRPPLWCNLVSFALSGLYQNRILRVEDHAKGL